MVHHFHVVPQHFSIGTGDTVESWNVPVESEASVPVGSEASVPEYFSTGTGDTLASWNVPAESEGSVPVRSEASGEFVESRAKK